jgi:hypothetical protein
MAFVYTWNSTFLSQPADTESEALGAGRIRDTKAAVGERLAIDHSLNGDANDGLHNWVTFPGANNPNAAIIPAGGVQIFTAVGSNGVTELWFRNSNGQNGMITYHGTQLAPYIGEVRLETIGGLVTAEGWLQCAGQAIDRTVYVNLFTFLGTNFGGGDGSTTFNIPNIPALATANQPIAYYIYTGV